MHTRTRAALAAGLLYFLPPAAARGAPAADPWLGRDKALHFGASFAVAIGGYAGASLVFEKRPGRMIAGAAFALSLGVAKEIADSHFGGDPSVRDLAWDATGAALGILAAWAIDRRAIVAPPASRPPPVGRGGSVRFLHHQPVRRMTLGRVRPANPDHGFPSGLGRDKRALRRCQGALS